MPDELIKVRFLGSADPREENGKIMLEEGPDGEPRALILGGDPNDALVTVDELHMLTGRYQIEVIEEDQPSTASEPVVTPPTPEGSGASSAPLSTPASPPEPASPTAPSAA